MTAGLAQSRRVKVVVRAPEVKAGKEAARRMMVSCGYAGLAVMIVGAAAVLIWVQVRGKKNWAEEDARQEERLKAFKE